MSIQEYMKLPYNYIIKPVADESGAYFHASVLELDGCQSTGETFQEAYDALQSANITLGNCEFLAESMPLEESVAIRTRSIMGVEIPYVSMDDKPPDISYGFALTNSMLDRATLKFNEVKRLTRELAELETAVYRLAYAVKKTQKRANALENIIIPGFDRDIDFISDALEEKEREEFVRRKVIKAQRQGK